MTNSADDELSGGGLQFRSAFGLVSGGLVTGHQNITRHSTIHNDELFMGRHVFHVIIVILYSMRPSVGLYTIIEDTFNNVNVM